MHASGVITITTDFGHKGPFTAIMKGGEFMMFFGYVMMLYPSVLEIISGNQTFASEELAAIEARADKLGHGVCGRIPGVRIDTF